MRNVVVLKEVMLVAVMENLVLVMVHACYPTIKRTNKDNMRERRNTQLITSRYIAGDGAMS